MARARFGTGFGDRRAAPSAFGMLLLAVPALCDCRGPGRPEDRPIGTPGEFLPPAGWYLATRAAVEERLGRIADPGHADAHAPVPTAVLAWDGVCVCRDLAAAVFHRLLERLDLRVDPAEIGELLPVAIDDVRRLEGDVALAEIRADVLDDYGELWPAIASGNAAAVRDTPAAADFRARLAWLLHALRATPGIGDAYADPWLVRWFAGLAEADVRRLAAETWNAASAEPIGERTWSSGAAGRSGLLRASIPGGLAAPQETRDLCDALARAGVQVFLIASVHEAVAEAIAPLAGFEIPDDRIFGFRTETDPEGVLTTRLLDPADYPVPWGDGKAELVRRFLPGPPVLVAGAGDGDVALLRAFAETQLRLIVHVGQQGTLRGLIDEALAGGAYLLQGRDDNTCRFIPKREWIPYGETTPARLRPANATASRRDDR
jgi:hypothetical protein